MTEHRADALHTSSLLCTGDKMHTSCLLVTQGFWMTFMLLVSIVVQLCTLQICILNTEDLLSLLSR